MSALTDRLPGMFRRRTSSESDSPTGEEAMTASTTTGGGLDSEPVVVWDAANLMEAQVVKGRLESEGIPALIRGEALASIYGLTAGNLAAAKVLVPAPLAEKAVAILFADEGAEDGDAPLEDGDHPA